MNHSKKMESSPLFIVYTLAFGSSFARLDRIRKHQDRAFHDLGSVKKSRPFQPATYRFV